MQRAAAMAGLMLAMAGAANAQTGGDAAIRAIEQAQETAWNAHDIAGYVRPMAADAQFVTAFGLWWTSRDETQRKMGYAFRTMFAQSTLHLDRTEVTPLGADVAIVHNGWTLEGAKRPDGTDAGTVHGIQSQTLRLTGGAWQIVSAQDTLVVSELTPPPAATAAPAPAATSVAPAARPERPCLVATRSGCVIHKK